MSDLVSTYLRQARGFLVEGKPERSMELLKKARALSSKDPTLLIMVLKELSTACKLSGCHDEAGRYYLEWQSMAQPAQPGAAAQPMDKRRNFKAVPAALLGVAICLIILFVAGGTWYLLPKYPGASSEQAAPVEHLSPREKLLRDDVALVIVTGIYSGTVEGNHFDFVCPIATGSAFAINSDGYLLTNAHVVEAGETAPATLADAGFPDMKLTRIGYLACFGNQPGDHLDADLFTRSSHLDMAVLHINRKFAHPMVLATEIPHQGDEVFTVGYPGAVSDFLNDVNASKERQQQLINMSKSAGRINWVDVLFDSESFKYQLDKGSVSVSQRVIQGVTYVQCDALVSHGNSGGPLCNNTNQVLGMVTIGLGGVNPEFNGNNFAISADELRKELRLFLEKM